MEYAISQISSLGVGVSLKETLNTRDALKFQAWINEW
jgi:hypothetical protein